MSSLFLLCMILGLPVILYAANKYINFFCCADDDEDLDDSDLPRRRLRHSKRQSRKSSKYERRKHTSDDYDGKKKKRRHRRRRKQDEDDEERRSRGKRGRRGGGGGDGQGHDDDQFDDEASISPDDSPSPDESDRKETRRSLSRIRRQPTRKRRTDEQGQGQFRQTKYQYRHQPKPSQLQEQNQASSVLSFNYQRACRQDVERNANQTYQQQQQQQYYQTTTATTTANDLNYYEQNLKASDPNATTNTTSLMKKKMAETISAAAAATAVASKNEEECKKNYYYDEQFLHMKSNDGQLRPIDLAYQIYESIIKTGTPEKFKTNDLFQPKTATGTSTSSNSNTAMATYIPKASQTQQQQQLAGGIPTTTTTTKEDANEFAYIVFNPITNYIAMSRHLHELVPPNTTLIYKFDETSNTDDKLRIKSLSGAGQRVTLPENIKSPVSNSRSDYFIVNSNLLLSKYDDNIQQCLEASKYNISGSNTSTTIDHQQKTTTTNEILKVDKDTVFLYSTKAPDSSLKLSKSRMRRLVGGETTGATTTTTPTAAITHNSGKILEKSLTVTPTTASVTASTDDNVGDIGFSNDTSEYKSAKDKFQTKSATVAKSRKSMIRSRKRKTHHRSYDEDGYDDDGNLVMIRKPYSPDDDNSPEEFNHDDYDDDAGVGVGGGAGIGEDEDLFDMEGPKRQRSSKHKSRKLKESSNSLRRLSSKTRKRLMMERAAILLEEHNRRKHYRSRRRRPHSSRRFSR